MSVLYATNEAPLDPSMGHPVRIDRVVVRNSNNKDTAPFQLFQRVGKRRPRDGTKMMKLEASSSSSCMKHKASPMVHHHHLPQQQQQQTSSMHPPSSSSNHHWLVPDECNPFVKSLDQNLSERLDDEDDDDDFANVLKASYYHRRRDDNSQQHDEDHLPALDASSQSGGSTASSSSSTSSSLPAEPPHSSSRQLLSQFYARQRQSWQQHHHHHPPQHDNCDLTMEQALTVLSDHRGFHDDDDRIFHYYGYDRHGLLVQPTGLARPSLLLRRQYDRRPQVTSAKPTHVRTLSASSSTSSCLSDFCSFESFTTRGSFASTSTDDSRTTLSSSLPSFAHDDDEDDDQDHDDNDDHCRRLRRWSRRRSATAVLGSSLRTLMHTRHHPQGTPTSTRRKMTRQASILSTIELGNLEEEQGDDGDITDTEGNFDPSVVPLTCYDPILITKGHVSGDNNKNNNNNSNDDNHHDNNDNDNKGGQYCCYYPELAADYNHHHHPHDIADDNDDAAEHQSYSTHDIYHLEKSIRVLRHPLVSLFQPSPTTTGPSL